MLIAGRILTWDSVTPVCQASCVRLRNQATRPPKASKRPGSQGGVACSALKRTMSSPGSASARRRSSICRRNLCRVDGDHGAGVGHEARKREQEPANGAGKLTTELTTTCCIAGGGPAGMVLGFLLARADVRTVVLEKHADFLRDFRGDTIHPSTLEVIHELGLLDAFLKLPHRQARYLSGFIGDTPI